MDAGRILLMRHAEKSDDPLDPDLSPAGHRRAEQLASFIPARFGTPDFLFATAESKHSRRPIETITPLSQSCGVPIDSSFADQDYAALAHELTKKNHIEGKLILVCWHHGNIPSLAYALGAKNSDYPDPWPADVFNLILKFKFAGGDRPSVEQLTEPF
jgi:broad specificity phosphatase PhoE